MELGSDPNRDDVFRNHFEANVQSLTSSGTQAIQDLSRRYGVSVDAVRALLYAVSAGGGTMAQFYHPDLGGGGQWMQGGMTMVGDMFNHGLKATVDGLCLELSRLLSTQQVFLAAPEGGRGNGIGSFGNAWWPAELGNPSSSGGQNDARYAYFPQARRLALDRNGEVTIYDTLDHQVGGVQQQQGGAYGSLSFSSQFGTFTVDSLPMVSPSPTQSGFVAEPPPRPMQQPQVQRNDAFEPEQQFNAQSAFTPSTSGVTATQSADDILATIERLSDLHQRGVLSEDEFRSKKADLLGRL